MAAGLDGLNNKIDPGEPLFCNMYTDYKNYPNLERLPNEIEESLENLEESKTLKEAFGEKVIAKNATLADGLSTSYAVSDKSIRKTLIKEFPDAQFIINS